MRGTARDGTLSSWDTCSLAGSPSSSAHPPLCPRTCIYTWEGPAQVQSSTQGILFGQKVMPGNRTLPFCCRKYPGSPGAGPCFPAAAPVLSSPSDQHPSLLSTGCPVFLSQIMWLPNSLAAGPGRAGQALGASEPLSASVSRCDCPEVFHPKREPLKDRARTRPAGTPGGSGD